MKQFAITLAILGLASPAAAELPSWLRIENSEVRDGNEAIHKGDAKGALEAYNRAARKLPDAPGVQLDRGIALLKQGEYAKSREALLAATSPSAPNDVRADAYQDLALSFYREADGLAGQNNHQEAQKMFREALDASKRSLHLRPGDKNTAWNLELAARRIREEEQKQKEEDEKKKQEQQDKKDDQKQDGDQQNGDPQDKKDDQGQNEQKPDSGDKDQQGDKQDKQDKPEQPKPEDSGDKNKPKDEPKQQDQQPAEPDAKKPPEQALPREASQALDSLEDGEENFERYRARQRANRERRAPEKDW